MEKLRTLIRLLHSPGLHEFDQEVVTAPKKWILGWYWGFSGGFCPFWKELHLKEHGQKEPGLLQKQAWSQVGKATWPAGQATPAPSPCHHLFFLIQRAS